MSQSVSFSRPVPSLTLNGGALSYTLMISMLASMILGILILINHLHQRHLDRIYARELALNNAYSGLEKLLSQPIHWGESVSWPLFENEIDSVYIRTEKWGLMGLVHAKGIHGHGVANQSVQVGGSLPEAHRFSLLITEGREPLTLVGDTRIEGPVYLPNKGLRGGFIGRRGFEGTYPEQGVVYSNGRERIDILPSWLDSLAWEARLWTLGEVPNQHEIRDLVHFQPWDTSTYRIEVPGAVILRKGIELRGKVKIIAKEAIVVENGAVLEDIILMAPNIRIESGFSGQLQALATQKLLVGDSVRLAYPTFLCLGKSGREAGELRLGTASRLEGGIVYLDQAIGGQRHQADRCQTGPDAFVAGIIHASHNLDVSGSVTGRVSTGNFVVQTPGASYRNHLLDAHLSVRGLSQTYAGPLLFPAHAYRVIQWLPTFPSIPAP